MVRSIFVYRSIRFAFPLLALTALGCGSSGTPADPDQAQHTLQVALDAWKGGESPEALARRSPPIHVSDTDWRGGQRLEGYQADSMARTSGFDVNYPVVLEFKDAKGKRIKKKTSYAVATHPVLAVVRQEN